MVGGVVVVVGGGAVVVVEGGRVVVVVGGRVVVVVGGRVVVVVEGGGCDEGGGAAVVVVVERRGGAVVVVCCGAVAGAGRAVGGGDVVAGAGAIVVGGRVVDGRGGRVVVVVMPLGVGPRGGGGAKAPAGRPSLAAAIRSRQMPAGIEPPVTARTPSMSRSGMLPSGNPTHTEATRFGVYPTNQALV